jgi:hypothetical protein
MTLDILEAELWKIQGDVAGSIRNMFKRFIKQQNIYC